MKNFLLFPFLLTVSLITGAVFSPAIKKLVLPEMAYAQKSDTPNAADEKSWMLQDEKNTIDVFNRLADSVVYVNNTTLVRNIFSMDVHEVPSGVGSGFLWDHEGHVVTNYHVVQRANKVKVTFKDGRSFDAKVVGTEARKDIALLKISGAKNLPAGFASQLADSSKIVPGQKSIAIGNPFELSHTLTTGVISAIGRSFPSPTGITIRDMIQTDASINPGNSGGPLIDSRGYLMGMNTAIYSESGNSAGVGFAVPTNTIKRVVSQLIRNGKVVQPGLGIEPLPEYFTRYFKHKGLVIAQTRPGGAAQKAGLRGLSKDREGNIEIGDIITAVDNKKIESLDDLFNVLEENKVGDKVTVEYNRKGTKKSITVTLEDVTPWAATREE